MEPLDPKAELMRLADLYALDLANCDFIPDETNISAKNASREALSAAITKTLSDARRLALEEAAQVCDERRKRRLAIPPKNKECVVSAEAYDCAAAIRALIDGKAGGT